MFYEIKNVTMKFWYSKQLLAKFESAQFSSTQKNLILNTEKNILSIFQNFL